MSLFKSVITTVPQEMMVTPSVVYEFRIIYWKSVKTIASRSEILIKNINFYSGQTMSRGENAGKGKVS